MPNAQAGQPFLDYILFSEPYLHIWIRLLHPQPMDAPCRGDKGPI